MRDYHVEYKSTAASAVRTLSHFLSNGFTASITRHLDGGWVLVANPTPPKGTP